MSLYTFEYEKHNFEKLSVAQPLTKAVLLTPGYPISLPFSWYQSGGRILDFLKFVSVGFPHVVEQG